MEYGLILGIFVDRIGSLLSFYQCQCHRMDLGCTKKCFVHMAMVIRNGQAFFQIPMEKLIKYTKSSSFVKSCVLNDTFIH